MSEEKGSRNWREYLVEIRSAFDVYSWVWNKVISNESKQWAKKMFLAILCSMVLESAKPWCLSEIINGLIHDQPRSIAIGFLGFFFLFFSRGFFDRKNFIAREWVFGLNQIQVDTTCLRAFLEKSLDQHLRENQLLSMGNIEKGRDKLFRAINVIFLMAWKH